jgi:hypothetical protein
MTAFEGEDGAMSVTREHGSSWPTAARHAHRKLPASLYPAQNAQAQIRLGRLLEYVQLYKALGGGWNLKDPQVPPSTAAAQEPASCAEKKC